MPPPRKPVTLGSNSYQGFTLAETLITLGIVSVIAALVIPPFINHQKELQKITILKKFYSNLLTAHNQIFVEFGLPSTWGLTNGNDGSSDKIIDLYETQLKIVKRCKLGSNQCFSNSITAKSFGKFNPTSFGASFILSDGVSVLADANHNSFFLFVDFNGTKPPNYTCKDVFVLAIDPNGKIISESYGGGTFLPEYKCFFDTIKSGWQK